MAEWSKALVLGTSHYGGAGSNPAPVSNFQVNVTVKEFSYVPPVPKIVSMKQLHQTSPKS